ncbi:MAG: methyltransferase domain-containing protein [Pseudomonadota bacterium]
MSPPESLTSVLACPRSDAPLEIRDDVLYCRASDVRYPLLGGIPWLFAEPDVARGEWRQRYQHANTRLDEHLAGVEAALVQPDLSAATRARLDCLQTGFRTQRAALSSLLKPLLEGSSSVPRATYLALRTRLPADQGLNTYLPNVHRDWGWGDAENAGSLEMLSEVLGTANPQRVLVLGAGAGRLAHDLNVALAPELCVGLDFNPLLMLLAARLDRGEDVQLVEFPMAPRTNLDHAVVRRLRAATKPATPTQWVLGDALRAPFQAGAFDLVVTPWLVDIISESPAAFAPRVNRLLAADGVWLNFGSVAFREPDIAACIGIEELTEQCVSGGFAHRQTLERELPYLDSPASRHGRVETVAAMRFDKTSDAAVVPRWRALPDWIVIGKTPVPASDAFLSQAAATRIHAFIMALIDGRRSLQDMASIMQQRGLMPAADAEEAIRGFLIKMHDDARRYSGF